MGFSIPNYTDAVTNKTVGDQAEPDSVDFQILGNPANGLVYDPTNFQYNGRVQASGTIGNTVEVDPYKVLINGSYLFKSSSTTVTLTGGSSSPRFDLIVVAPSSTEPSVIVGTASATNPEFPPVTEGYVVLAAIYRAGSGVSGYVEARNIIDKRLFVNSNQAWVKSSSPLVNTTDAAAAKVGDLWLDTSASGANQTMLWIKQPSSWVNLPTYIAASTTSSPNTLVLRDSGGNFTASAVAWDDVTGKPTNFVLNDSTTYGINTSGNAGYATNAGYASTAGNATTANSATSASYLQTGGGLLNFDGTRWATSNALWVTGGLSVVGSSIYYGTVPTSASTDYIVRRSDGILCYRSGTSLRAHKENIESINDGLDLINSLTPRSFIFKEEVTDMGNPFEVFARRTQTQYGFVVDEIMEVNSDLIDHKEVNGEFVPQMWKHEAILAHAVKAIQELSTKNAELEARIEALEAK